MAAKSLFDTTLTAALWAVALLAAAGATAAPPKLGVAIDDASLDALSITVFPDGRGLPPGSGDATSGAKVFNRQCRACHGAEGAGGINDALTGGFDTLRSSKPKRTVGSYWPYATTVFDYVRRAMPYNAPGSLTANELYAVTAYLLATNKIIETEEEMNKQSLPKVVMPNQDSFIWLTGDKQ